MAKTQREIEAEHSLAMEELKQQLMASGIAEDKAQACLDALERICLNHLSNYLDNKKASQS